MNISIFVIFLLSLIWTCTVLSNVIHCTTAGSVANWWHRDTPSKDIVKKTFKRSLTTLLGSICLGSLLVAAVRTVRVVVHLVFSKLTSRSRENSLRKYLRCVLDVCLQGLDWLVQYFNKYSFCYGTWVADDWCACQLFVLYSHELAGNRSWSSFRVPLCSMEITSLATVPSSDCCCPSLSLSLSLVRVVVCMIWSSGYVWTGVCAIVQVTVISLFTFKRIR